MTDRMTQSNDTIRHDDRGDGGTVSASYVEQQVSLALTDSRALPTYLMERICSTANLNQAYKRVKANKGAAGIDKMSVEELHHYLKAHGQELRQSLLKGTYTPQPVRGVKIAKPNDGERQLGIPTVLDRFVQQAIHQVLETIFDSTFSESSYGFRPKRSAHQALKRAGEYVATGYVWVVDIDLEKYFDTINHDILMSRLSKHIGDRRLLKIIRLFLQAGLMQDGVCQRRQAGTPQGGPLSPLLSNILLDDLDKELERRGHKFCRYADDCNIYVRSYKAGERVLASIKHFLESRLGLTLNESKSAVALVREREFLGYTLKLDGKLKISDKSLKRMKDKVRLITKRNRGRNFQQVIIELNRYLMGWLNYFSLSTKPSLFLDLDSWIRRRLRCYRVKQRKRRWPLARYLMELGLSKQSAWHLAMSRKSWWRKSRSPNINMAMSLAWFNELGLLSLVERYVKLTSV